MSEDFSKFIVLLLTIAFLTQLPRVLKDDYLARKNAKNGNYNNASYSATVYR